MEGEKARQESKQGWRVGRRGGVGEEGRTHFSPGVLGMPWMAKSGATWRWGVVAEPTVVTLCKSSPRMQPADHISIADV